MTDSDLATLVRAHVSADEPPFRHTAADAVGRGRGVVRRRRGLAGLAGATGLALAAVAVPPLLLDDDGTAGRVVDPAVAAALADYDAGRMPQVMDDRARPVLEASVPHLGPAEFIAFDDQLQQLPARYWDKASGLVTRYGTGSDHRLSVTLEHSRGSAEGDPERSCAEGLESGYDLECTVRRTADGDAVITTLTAMRPMGGVMGAVTEGPQAWSDDFMGVSADELDTVRPDRLWFSRTVKVVKSETFVTWTSEVVRAPDPTTARDLLVVPADDLATIGLDPALVMPPPPPGDGNGCPAWTMPTEGMQVSCADEDGEPLVD